MVRKIVLFIIFFLSLNGGVVEEKVKSLINQEIYQTHYKLIKKLFQNEEQFLLAPDKVDMVKIIKILKKNGLLNLFFNLPQKSYITFETNSNPLFFMKIVEDNLRNMGYYLVFTDSIDYSEKYFKWRVHFVSEYMIDPELFINLLKRDGCEVLDIKREGENEWVYFINMDRAHLDVEKITPKVKTRLKKPINDYWLNISGGSKISIASYGGNRWYPKIAIYDKNLHILRVYEKKEKSDWLVLYLPANAYYIKISDIFTLENLKYGLNVTLE